MKRVIITGGSGMIARALTTELAANGYEVIALTRNPAKMRNLPPHTRAVAWDGRTAQGWGEWVNGETHIVNLAGSSIAPFPWWLPGRRKSIRDSRVNSGRAIDEAVKIAKEKPRAVVQTSGVHYYGVQSAEPADEATLAGDEFLAAVCVAWENATRPVESFGVRRAIYRTGIVLNRNEGILFYIALPFHFFLGGPLGDGKQWVPWIHIRDEVRAIRFLLENENARGVFNFVAPNPVTNAEMGRALSRVLQRPFWFPVPAFILRLIFGEMAEEVLLTGRVIKPARLLELGFQFQFPEIEAALRDVYSK